MKHFSKYNKNFELINQNITKIDSLLLLKKELILNLKKEINNQFYPLVKRHIKESLILRSNNNELTLSTDLSKGEDILMKVNFKKPVPINSSDFTPIEDLNVELRINNILYNETDVKNLIGLGKISNYIFANKVKIINKLNSIFLKNIKKIEIKCLKPIKKLIVSNHNLKVQNASLVEKMLLTNLQTTPLTLKGFSSLSISPDKIISYNKLKIISTTPSLTTYELDVSENLNNTKPHQISLPSDNFKILNNVLNFIHIEELNQYLEDCYYNDNK